MENSFKPLLDASKSVLILLPVNPDFDAVSSGLSLYLSLKGVVDVQIACPTLMTVEFNRLIGVNRITDELGNKNLVIRFREYKANDIERVSYDIEDAQFRLTVIPKPGVGAPQKDQVDLAYSGISSDLVVLVGGAAEESFPALTTKELIGAKLIHVGIKGLEVDSSKNVISFAHPASSISELFALLIGDAKLAVDADIATNLLMGIEEGSGDFTGADVTATTFELIARLMRAGAHRVSKATLPTAQNYPIGAVPGQILQPEQISSVPTVGSIDAVEGLASQNKDKGLDVEEAEVPNDWLAKPKIYKGTSLS